MKHLLLVIFSFDAINLLVNANLAVLFNGVIQGGVVARHFHSIMVNGGAGRHVAANMRVLDCSHGVRH
jgi:hypothetical protein